MSAIGFALAPTEIYFQISAALFGFILKKGVPHGFILQL
jgi:hypothetical protein